MVVVARLELVRVNRLARKRSESSALGNYCFFAKHTIMCKLGQKSGPDLELVGQLELFGVDRRQKVRRLVEVETRAG